MISYLSADYVYPVSSSVLKNGVIGLDDQGMIHEVLSAEAASGRRLNKIIHYEGLLVPGFVNTHCHLELSHLKGKIKKHTGLNGFVQQVMKLRGIDEYAISLAMLEADKEMLRNGIVAVGDIANQAVSKTIKRASPQYYYTFLEVMGFNPASARASAERAVEFKASFGDFPIGIVPHAPYSVSAALFAELKLAAEAGGGLLSIHNQETADENLFFEQKQGEFLKLYEFLGLNIDFYEPSGKSSLQTILPYLSPSLKTLLVHNTFTSREDVRFAKTMHHNLYWCLCPNANLYIENKLPDVGMLRSEGLKITLGTDSLASNDVLSIFAEMQTLQEHFEIPVEELIRWATWNGAEFLGVDQTSGSLEVGKRPGINLLEYSLQNGTVVLGTGMEKLY
jgi:cytosine/adenosine deaminase-related metal-dependent hydrolase